METTTVCKRDDYSNTIIYKITCKDPNIKDIYVGHTINFVQRKRAHKQNCISDKSPSYKCKLYETIRNNGGWSNWTMTIIHFFSCSGLYAAKQIEQEYFVSLNANLNSMEPCKNNNVVSEPNMNNIFYCNQCEYKTSIKFSYDRHMSTKKHKKLYQKENSVTNICGCGEVYNSRTTLWRHKKICITQLNVNKNNNEHSLLVEILKQNQDYQQLILQQQKQIYNLTAKSSENI